MYYTSMPQFQLRWLRFRSPGYPEWLFDDAWTPAGKRRVFSRSIVGLHQFLTEAYSDLTEESTQSAPVLYVPSFIPGGVVWAALAAGFDVEYYPLNQDLRLPAGKLAEQFAESPPDVIVVVHYFGFSDPNVDHLFELAESHDTIVIEDCARGLFGRDRDGQLLGSRGDLAIFSLHKTLRVPSGGLVVSQTYDVSQPTAEPSELGGVLRAAARGVISKTGVIPSFPHPPTELLTRDVDAVAPADQMQNAGPGVISKLGLAQTDPKETVAARCRRYDRLRALLAENGYPILLTPKLYDGCAPYGVAVQFNTVTDRNNAYVAVRKTGLPADVFSWPIVYAAERAFSIRGTRELRNRVLVLPTHQDIPFGSIETVAKAVRESVDVPTSSQISG